MQISMCWGLLSIVAVLVQFVSTGNALAPILLRGNKMYNADTGERFIMRGMTYEYEVSDESYETNSKVAIETNLKELLKNNNLNALRIYNINPEKSYKKFMDHMEKLGIYVMIAASPGNEPYYGSVFRYATMRKDLTAEGTETCYPSLLLNYGKQIAKMFAAYNHTLGMIIANEVLQASLTPAACVKQYAADLKNWMRANSKNMRLIPLAYAAADGAYAGTPKPDKLVDAGEYHQVKIQGFLCGDSMIDGTMQQSLDIYLINEYRWCTGNTFANSYKGLLDLVSGVPIVVGLGEYGCDKIPPRKWEMIQYLFGDSSTSSGFSDVFSGGFAYSFGEANLGKNTGYPLFTGGSTDISGKAGTVVTSDYTTLVSMFVKYPSVKDAAEWDSKSKCAWTPKLPSSISPVNQRAAAFGWIAKKCSDIKVGSTDTWITTTRQNAICNDKGEPCEVQVPTKVGTTQQDLCGGKVSVVSGGSACTSNDQCSGNGKCDNGTCKCTGCFSGPTCAFKDSNACDASGKNTAGGGTASNAMALSSKASLFFTLCFTIVGMLYV